MAKWVGSFVAAIILGLGLVAVPPWRIGESRVELDIFVRSLVIAAMAYAIIRFVDWIHAGKLTNTASSEIVPFRELLNLKHP